MSEEEILDYVLNLLEPEEQSRVEAHLSAHPEDAARIDRLRLQLGCLASERDNPPIPPPGLAVRTISRLAQHLLEEDPNWLRHEQEQPSGEMERTLQFAEENTSGADAGVVAIPRDVEPSTLVQERAPRQRFLPGWLRPDLVVAVGIGILAAGLVVVGIDRSRDFYRFSACQGNLSRLYQALVTYSDTHEGEFPKIDAERYPTAGHFTAALKEAEYNPTKFGFSWHDPGFREPDACLLEALRNGWHEEVPSRVQYAYSLGYRTADGQLHGLRRHGADASSDLLPIAADFPWRDSSHPATLSEELYSPHRRGHNVLYVGGHVRTGKTPHMGLDDDDIYHNQAGQPRAGLHSQDAVLGRPNDRP